ncbi:hypothetical protein BJ944DRAFT_251607 [Cunninghamella echinulata]|nr:hypothetical protein BJ944DRAFT_251607 [Cunninghamella echinulata]
MTINHIDITEDELTLLEQQFLYSPFGQQQQHLNNNNNDATKLTTTTTTVTQPPLPTKLVVFDFDSTLFLSPLLSSNLWDHHLINAITTEYLFGPGFWRDIRTLQLANNDNHKETLINTKWDGYWNEMIVEKVKQAMQQPDTLTVLLTGRRAYPFAPLINQMLACKGLFFDILGYRPDPFLPNITATTDDEQQQHDNDNNKRMKDVFLSTMDFKSAFILHLKTKIPSLKEIIMWDDRPSQLPILNQFVNQLVEQHYFDHGQVNAVKALRPKYNPDWEIHLIESILSTHNQRLLEKKKIEKIMKEEEEEDISVIINDKGHVIHSSDPVQLIQYSTSTKILKVAPSSIQSLYQTFDPIYQQFVEKNKTSSFSFGEQPIFFGDMILQHLSVTFPPNLLSNNNFDNNDDDEMMMELIITGYHIGSFNNKNNKVGMEEEDELVENNGMVLQVHLKDYPDDHFILPLWYKPSQFQKLSGFNYSWTTHENKPMYEHLCILAKLDHLQLYGLEKKN